MEFEWLVCYLYNNLFYLQTPLYYLHIFVRYICGKVIIKPELYLKSYIKATKLLY